MVCFQTKNRNLGKFWRVFLSKILVYFITIWSILRPLEIVYGHLVCFVVIWYLFPRFGILDQGKSSNPGKKLLGTYLCLEFNGKWLHLDRYGCFSQITAHYLTVQSS
jgi:hypothetical protein